MQFTNVGMTALCCLWVAVSPALGEMKRAVGFAEGSYAFQVNGKKIDRHTTLFDGETVTSALLPTQLSIAGNRFGLGIASQAKVFSERLVLEGGSLRLAGETSRVAVEVAGLRVRLSSDDTIATVYTSQPDQLSIVVENGAVVVLDGAGREIARATSEAATVVRNTRGSAKAETSDEPMEVAEIQAKQAEFLGDMERSISGAGYTEKSRTLLAVLAGASAGRVGTGGVSSGQSVAGRVAPSEGNFGINGLSLTAATIDVGRQLQSDSTSQKGCSTYRECYPVPVISDNRPYGIVTGVVVLSGCAFCSTF